MAASSAAHAADWTRWRGPNADGTTPESGWSPGALAGELKPVWKLNVGKGYSAVSIKGQRLYTMGNRDDTDIVHCLDAGTGGEIWTHTYSCKGASYPGPRATPVLDATSVYTMSREGHVFCLDEATGEVKWEKNLQADDEVENLRWGLAGTPCIEGDLLIVNAGRSGVALNKTTGATVWANTPGKGGYASPVIFSAGKKRCAAIFGKKEVYAIDVKTGEELWSYPWKTKYDIHAADPIVDGDTMFISSGYGTGCALLDIGDDGPKEIWRNESIASHFSTAILIDGHLYGIDGNAGRGSLRCVEIATGTTKWTGDTGFGSLIASDGKLIVLEEKGSFIVVEAQSSAYKEMARSGKVLSSTCWTAPVLANSHIFARDDKGNLVCINIGP